MWKKGKKSVRKCYNCNSTQHLANKCDRPKKEKKPEKGEKSAKAAFMMGLLGVNQKRDWYIDSGATRHMTPHDDLIENKNGDVDKITAANGAKIDVTGTGEGKVTFGDGNVKLKNIMHVPELAVNLLSVSQIAQKGNTVIFNAEGCSIYNDENKCVLFCKSTSDDDQTPMMKNVYWQRVNQVLSNGIVN